MKTILLKRNVLLYVPALICAAFLFLAPITQAELISAEGDVILIAGSEYFPVTQASDGNTGTQWVTDAPCGPTADYFSCGPIPVMVMDLGSDRTINAVAYWGYGVVGNSCSEFSLRFATEEQGINGFGDGYNPEIHTGTGGTGVQQDFPFDRILKARYIEVTVTDNHIEAGAGGDRVGFGDIQFNVIDLNKARLPYPEDDDIDINPNGLILSWDGASVFDPVDPNNLLPNTDIVKHEVYIGTGNPDDPNVYFLGEVAADPGNLRAQYSPIDLERDGTYYWRVDETINDSNGLPVTNTGEIWVFQTLPSDPVIPFDSPAGVLVDYGQDAMMTVDAWNPYTENETGLSYQWYKVDPAGDIAMGEDSKDLVITGVTPEKEGLYYCVVTISDPPGITTSATSRQANLVIKKRIGYWPFDGDAADMDNGNDGVVAGGTPDFEAEGIVNGGKAVQLVQADSEYISIPNDPLEWSPTGSFSISMWVKPIGGSSHRCAISNRHEFPGAPSPDTQGFILYNEPGNTWQFWTGQTTLWNTLQGPNVIFNEWTHIVIMCDPIGLSETDDKVFITTKSLYINGVLAAQGEGNYRIKDLGNSDLFIGAGRNENPAAYFFDGLIDDLRIYNYPIEPIMVARLYTDVVGGEVCYEKPAYDFDDDCIISISDIAVLAAEWMECNLVPATECQ